MSDDQFCFGLFGIENEEETSSKSNDEKKEALNLSKDVDSNSKYCCICNSEDVKYCCPGCGFRTCSLNCVKDHKDVFECDGKRDKCPFVKLNDLDQRTFMSDFFLLDEAETAIDRAARTIKSVVQSRPELPSWLQKIRLEARMRGTRMKILPAGFEKRKRNRTIFHFREKCLQWTLEIKFNVKGSDYITIFKDRVSENSVVKDVIKEIIDPEDVIENMDQFNQFIPLRASGLDNLAIFLKVDGRNMFWKLNSNDTITKSLEGKTIVEYPTFIVTTKCKEMDYPIMATELVSLVKEQEVSNTNHND